MPCGQFGSFRSDPLPFSPPRLRAEGRKMHARLRPTSPPPRRRRRGAVLGALAVLAGAVLAPGSSTFAGAEAQMMAQDLPSEVDDGEQPLERTKLIEEGDCSKPKVHQADVVYVEFAIYLYAGVADREEEHVVSSSLHKPPKTRQKHKLGKKKDMMDPVPVSEAEVKDPPPGGFPGRQVQSPGMLDSLILPGLSTAVLEMCVGERSIWHIPAKESHIATSFPYEEGFKAELLLVRHHDNDKLGF